jgi:CHAT domain-containing protein/Flp pilus assembly protein TadD
MHRGPGSALARLELAVLQFVLLCGLVAAVPRQARADEPKDAAREERLAVAAEHWTRGYSLFGENKLAEATAAFTEAFAVERGVYGDDHDRVPELLRMLAEMYDLQQQFPQAADRHEEIRQIFARRFGAEHWKTIDSRIDVEYCRLRQRMSPEQLARLREARAMSGEVQKMRGSGEFTAALNKQQIVAVRYRELLGPQHSYTAIAKGKLAAMHYQLGQFESALTLYAEAQAIEKVALGEKHPEYATTLNNEAVLRDDLGEYSAAEVLYRKAMEIRRDALGTHQSDYATSLNNLAVHYDYLGDFVESEKLFKQAVELKKEALGDDDPDTIAALSNLGRNYLIRGKLDEAEPLLTQALKARETPEGQKHPEYASSLNNLALLKEASGDLNAARTLFKKALEVWKGTLGEKHPSYATTLGHLAEINTLQGEYATGEVQFREVLEIRRQSLGEFHPHFALTLSRLSLNLAYQERTAEATALAKQAVQIDREYCDQAAPIQSERQQFLTSRQCYESLDSLLSILASGTQVEDAVYEEILRAKGRVWRRQVVSRAVARAAKDQPELKRTLEEMQSIATQRAALVLSTPAEAARDEWQKKTRDLTDRQEQLERDLARDSSELRLALHVPTADDVRRALPARAALVDFVVYIDSRLRAESGPRKEMRIAAFIVTGESKETRIVDLGPLEPVAKLIDRWRANIKNPSTARTTAAQLRTMIWNPVREQIKEADLVLASPDGVLGRFPLTALPGDQPGAYLIEDLALAVMPCAMAVPWLTGDASSATERPEAAGNLLIVANVDYDHEQAMAQVVPPRKFGRREAVRGAGGWKSWGPLPGTLGEMASIQKLYRDTFGMNGITVLEQTGAQETKFCEEAVRHKYLHIATHGFFAPESLTSVLRTSATRSSSTELSPGDGASEIGFPPGLLSGLALSGANLGPTPERGDGILTASEVENLDLRGVQLVVLSACETGLGELAGGEGLLGLQRSFQIAGAQTVVATLWEVPDDATRSLMERFYENLLQKRMGTLESLREAQLWFLKGGSDRGLVRTDPDQKADKDSRPPPFSWAGFVLSGDWR